MTFAKIFKWERKTDEHGGVARGKEIVHTSVHIDSDHKEKERPNGQRLNGEATNKWVGGGEVLHRKGHRQEKSDREGKSGKRRWHIKSVRYQVRLSDQGLSNNG